MLCTSGYLWSAGQYLVGECWRCVIFACSAPLLSDVVTNLAFLTRKERGMVWLRNNTQQPVSNDSYFFCVSDFNMENHLLLLCGLWSACDCLLEIASCLCIDLVWINNWGGVLLFLIIMASFGHMLIMFLLKCVTSFGNPYLTQCCFNNINELDYYLFPSHSYLCVWGEKLAVLCVTVVYFVSGDDGTRLSCFHWSDFNGICHKHLLVSIKLIDFVLHCS